MKSIIAFAVIAFVSVPTTAGAVGYGVVEDMKHPSQAVSGRNLTEHRMVCIPDWVASKAGVFASKCLVLVPPPSPRSER